MRTLTEPELHVYPEVTALMEDLSLWLEKTTHESIKSHGFASWAVSGGKTPIPLFRLLADCPGCIPWESVQIYLVDERDVHPSDPLSNYGMLEGALLNHLKTPPARTYPWFTLGNPKEGLALYRRALSPLPRVDGFPALDLALVGMGGDGHTASVFPGSPQQQVTDWVAYGPGPGVNRFTLTLPLLSKARQIVFLVTGQDKAERVKECIAGTNLHLPAARLSHDAANVHWFLDREAAGGL